MVNVLDLTAKFTESRKKFKNDVADLNVSNQDIQPEWLVSAQALKQRVAQAGAHCVALQRMRGRDDTSLAQLDDQRQAIIEEKANALNKEIRQIQRDLSFFKDQTLAESNSRKQDAESKIVQSAMYSSLQTSLKSVIVTFRKDQYNYFQKLQGVTGGSNVEAATGSVAQNTAVELDENKINASLQQQLKSLDNDVEKREREIMQLAQNIREIFQLSQELAEMMVTQGTILDRIDENVTEALQYSEEGVEQLVEARKIQKKVMKLQIATYILVAAIIIMEIIYCLVK